MRRITEEHLADLCEADYRNLMGVTREEFGRMLQALEEGYRREHKRKPRWTPFPTTSTGWNRPC